MMKLQKMQEFRLTKEYLLKRIEKYLERGFVYRTDFFAKHRSKLKEWGVIVYCDKNYRYDIIIDVYNKLKEEEGL